ncbi:hypothetical protein FQK07_11465 [Synechococcus sp. BSF8S]|uniref:hypothetical protein n=1 Tax=Synechococcales TaxID=1890424 RepID=UPI0016244BE8|nr:MULTISPECIES: hypothetical protein [unclassified Synechococcus]MBC1261870.1 hypothetical protein [Synechococcus sp. BSF8S]MBC1264797.1 hypothetical protein [Synechococcus sp. BSA11S]
MTKPTPIPTPTFRDFEYAGWSNQSICETYDHHFGAVARQSIEALLDAAAVSKGTRILDVCTGAGYGAGLAAERGVLATGIDFPQLKLNWRERIIQRRLSRKEMERLSLFRAKLSTA